jgi:signal transduction histidine kinase
LNNVILHARARLVRVRVSAPRQTFRLSIIDDGKGFDPVRAAAKPGTHLGLRAAREMVEALGGEFIVHSAPGCGTSVLATLPPATPKP